MQSISARDAKNAFGRLIDMARAEPVAIEKYGRSVVVVLAIEEFERLTAKAKRKFLVQRPADFSPKKTNQEK
ncbi:MULTISPECIES: type II toxin-antitoxin system Phd/YefM family antitoxin [Alphaproteobacteria]|uniref:Antitoxin n=1 Tax=Ketogulonicigenium vulgare (strain WSH-001) TaxID=759362 RepID=F9YAU1_KETVW|nr:type II toxin-antitoxin system Phd/YefM family antitoxin [Ketogulonicigenium vulgare]ADO43966.1 prevent-host-death family protein [Ketogulonicigenium vulgare Y25]AEM42493.1 Prevent-host-death family protein [Ketogulonicigenium vulgare WSH-001]ALJ82536.1 prevent-host-death protein [Ketogulonicigenium vulgare]ANW35419.1 prevent-host-death protein [Ketogulonicigenium vulgare]